MSGIVVYPGSFDPITKGHIDLIIRGSEIFSEVIVAIAINSSKKCDFSIEKRLLMARNAVEHIDKVKVMSFSGLLTNFVKQLDVNIIMRGIRAVSDFDYEFQLAGMNRQLSDQIETVFLMPGEQVEFISSSLVKEVAKLQGPLHKFVTPFVQKHLIDYYK